MNYVVYASKRSVETTEDDIDDIILSAEKHNSNCELTGILLIKTDYFLQYFEGEEREITALLTKLQQDKRHYDLKILDRGVLAERLFPNWKMSPLHSSIEHSEYVKRIEQCPIPHLRHILNKYFINEGPVSIAYNEMPF